MTIIIADDHPLYMEALAYRIQRIFADAHVVQVTCLEEALAVANNAKKAVRMFLLDYHMPGVSSATLEHLVRQYPTARVAVISGSADPDEVREVVRAGAHGFIPKTAKVDHLQHALQMLLAGGTSVPAEYLLRAEPPVRMATWAADLSDREIEVMGCLARGLSNKQIARELGLAEVTAKLHVSSIFRKTGANSRSEAAVLASKFRFGDGDASSR
jgi:two-component system nitrate/nitrite response regulator NarL